MTNLLAAATLASLAAAVPRLKSITAPPTPVMLICSLVSVVAPSYVLAAATVAVALLTTNDLASPAKKLTPGAFAEVSVGVRVRLYVPALRVLDNVVLMAIVPVISPVLMVIVL